MAKRVELILLHPASALWQVLNVVALNRVCLQVRHLMDHSVTVGLFGPYELLQVEYSVESPQVRLRHVRVRVWGRDSLARRSAL
jgi:hypothetical protein